MAYHALNALEPDAQAWKHFYEDIKPAAYAIDETEGTTPIYQDIPNLKDAKSAYGAIVYQKAPSILKQLEFRLGAESFRNGLRIYLRQHAYGNAEWSDLIAALQTASSSPDGHDVRTWADAWVLRRGMPEITPSWSCGADGKVATMTLTQHDVLPDGYTWPISNELLLGYGGNSITQPAKIRVDWSTSKVDVPSTLGQPCPSFVFANAGDEAYGRFLLDTQSEQSVRQPIARSADRSDPLLRSMLWGALWDNVHVAKSSPRSYVELVLANLPHESDETLARIQGGHAATALHSYMTDRGRSQLVPQLEQIATDRMLHAEAPALRIVNFRILTAVAETPAGLETLKQLLSGSVAIPGVELRSLDRWNLVGHLIAQGDPDSTAIFTSEQKRDQTGDGLKYAWAVQAAAPDAATKQRYFAAYQLPPTDSAAKPEDWLTQSLRPFNSWNQSALTEPYLTRALDQLPEIKRDRKIFYLGAWLAAFLQGQISPEAQAQVNEWLAKPGIDPDLRRKVLENADDLNRTVRIRERFPD
jgi:aminopeptidase N